MPHYLDQSEAVPEALRRIASEELASTTSLLKDGADEGSDERVHEARKSLKRLRGLIRLGRSALLPDAFKRENATFRDSAPAQRGQGHGHRTRVPRSARERPEHRARSGSHYDSPSPSHLPMRNFSPHLTLGGAAMLALGACQAERSSSLAGKPAVTTVLSVPPHTSAVASAPARPLPKAAGSARALDATPPSASGTRMAADAPQLACSAEMAKVGDYCIDRYEAHLVALDPAGSERPHPHSKRPERGVRYRACSRAGVFPQAYVNRTEAAAACALAGKRLCSVEEWFNACTNQRQSTFPYVGAKRRHACNTGKPHLLTRLFGGNAHNWQYDEHFNSPALNLLPGYLARAGEYSECVTNAGVYDLVGNLHEWVADSVNDELPSKVPLLDAIRFSVTRNRGHGIFMGGFYSTTSEQGEGCHFLTPGHEPGYHDYSTGFRCCKDAG